MRRKFIVNRLSAFLSGRMSFLVLMAAAAALKLVISAVVPASHDLRNILISVEFGSDQSSPWVALEAQMFEFWRSVTHSTQSGADWWQTPPPAMSMDLRLLSLFLRLPTFVFDLAIAFTLYFTILRLASSREAKLVTLLWFLNPFTTFEIEMLSVPDVAATFLTLVAVFFLLRKREILAGLFLAAGIAVKLYPILLVPPILLYARERLETRLRSQVLLVLLPLCGLIAYLGWVFPTGKFSLAPFTDYSPITQPMTVMFVFGYPVHYISVASVALVTFYFAIWVFAKRAIWITDTILPVLLVYYTFFNPYPQYFVWALPFLTLDVILVRRQRLPLLALLLALAFGAWFTLSAAYLTPSGYSLFLFPLEAANLPWYSQMINSFLRSNSAELVAPLLFSALYATTLIYALDVARGWFALKPE